MSGVRTVWKFDLELGANAIEVYEGARVVRVGFDGGGKRCVWVEVETSRPAAVLELVVVGTGHHIPGDAEHVGSFMEDGYFIWHAYQVKEASDE